MRDGERESGVLVGRCQSWSLAAGRDVGYGRVWGGDSVKFDVNVIIGRLLVVLSHNYVSRPEYRGKGCGSRESNRNHVC